MPPVPLHIEDPITPSKAQGVTPQTEPPQPSTTTQVEARTTAAPTSTQTYAAARPGAAAVPAPTSAVSKPQPQPTRTYDSTQQTDLPAPPQPGAVPQPNALAFQTNATSIPPPSTASIGSHLPPTVTAAPDQTQWAAPQQNYAPTHSTDASTSAKSRAGPTTVNLGPVTTSPAAHPPGYQQNVYAQELTSQQRASLDQQEAREKQEHPLGALATPQVTGTAENAWDAVRSWTSKATEAAANAHGEAWKWIDSKK